MLNRFNSAALNNDLHRQSSAGSQLMQFNTNTDTGPVPYRDAIRSLEKIQQCTTPREKLQCLSDSYSGLKTAVVDYHKGKLELVAMDDLLPLTIYVVSQAEVSHIAS